MRLRFIVFDLDGTLVDSRRDLAESANAVLEEAGCATHAEEAIGEMVGDGAATLVARAFEASRCPQPPDALARFLAIYNGRLLQHTRAYPGIADALKALGAQVPLAILTNKPLGPTREILAGLALDGYFDAPRIVGGDGPFPRKPDPAALLHLIAGAGAAPSETALIGDSVIDWRTARSAGAQIGLARWGFGFAGVPLKELRPADRILDRPADLLSLL